MVFRYSMIGNDLESYCTPVQNCVFAQNAFFFR
jgi:hypothetical protein